MSNCAYFGCQEPVTDEEELTYTEATRLCSKHAAEANALVESGNFVKLLVWWINAKGGPEKIAALLNSTDT